MFESEEDKIVRKIKGYIINKEPQSDFYIMLRNERILDYIMYRDMVSAGKINPQDAYVYIDIGRPSSKPYFYYPFLELYKLYYMLYLSKLGFKFGYHYGIGLFPYSGLKYMVVAVTDDYEKYLAIELVKFDTIVNNTNLSKIVAEALGEKLVSGQKELTEEECEKILGMYKSQKLFAGHNFDEAWNIIENYYDNNNKSLVKEVARIAMDYARIFQPYRTCYDMEKGKEVDCLSIVLD